MTQAVTQRGYSYSLLLQYVESQGAEVGPVVFPTRLPPWPFLLYHSANQSVGEAQLFSQFRAWK